LAPKAFRARRDVLAFQDLKEHKVKKVFRGRQDSGVLPAHKVELEHKVYKAKKVIKAFRDLRVNLEYKAHRAHRAHKGLACKALKVKLEHKEHKERQVR
jgi:hypothetical protein